MFYHLSISVALIERRQILAHRTARRFAATAVDCLSPRDATGAISVGLDDAGVDRESSTAYESAFARAWHKESELT